MIASIILSKIMGLYLIIVGLAMLLNRNYYQTTFLSLIQNNPLYLISGLMALIFGLIMIVFHNIWKLEWTLIITLLAWLTLIKGFIRVILPEHLHTWQQKMIQNKVFYSIITIVMILLGICLTYFGFFYS